MGEQSRCAIHFVLGIFCAGMLIGGCAPSGTDAGRQIASALCQKAAECCSDGEIRAIFNPYTTRDDCTDRLVARASVNWLRVESDVPWINAVALPNLTYLDQAIKEGRIKVDGDMLHRCTEEINKAVCAVGAIDAGTSAGAVPTCKPIDPTLIVCDYSKLFVGQVAEGGHCATAGGIEECADGLFCLDAGIDGVCVQRGKEGEFCVNDGECVTTLYCNQLSGTCQPKGKLGESCAYDNFGQTDLVLIPCERYLACDPFARICVSKCNEGYPCLRDYDCDQNQGLRCIVGYCDDVRQQDQPCDSDNDCGSNLRCEPDGDLTNNYAYVCVPKIADNAAGCLQHADCQSDFCDLTGGATCRPKVAPPGACPSQLHEQCAGGYCSSGSCAPLVADGAACQFGYQCQSGACVASLCARPPLANGLRCTIGAQCTSGFCNYESPPYCDSKPLDNGKRCSPTSYTGLSTLCASNVCVNGLCAEGLPVGADCTPASGKPPCAPMLYCDTALTPWACQPKHGPGDDCTPFSGQCFGSCVPMSGRWICDETAPLGGMVCGGNGAQ
jgi:hypothetical protein